MSRHLPCVLTCLLIISTIEGHSQYYSLDGTHYSKAIVMEAGSAIGIMNCLTDLGGKKGIGKKGVGDVNWGMSRPAAGIYLAAMYRECVALRVEATFGSVQAADSVLKSVAATTYGRSDRNLSFRSPIQDFQFSAEIHPFFFKTWEEDAAPYFSPYIVGGIGFFAFDPRALLDGKWQRLQPLRTEGQGLPGFPQRIPYKLLQVNVPVGFGVKYEVSSILNARIELTYRLLFTDYLDDVSKTYVDPLLFDALHSPERARAARKLAAPNANVAPGSERGNPENNDAFFTIQLKLGVTLRQKHAR